MLLKLKNLIRFLNYRTHSHIANICKPTTLLEDANLSEPLNPYYIENRLRKVYPYYYEHTTYCKGRWVGRNIVDVYSQEFALYPREEYVKRLRAGLLTVNGQAVDPDYNFRMGDLLKSKIHRHELPVLASPIEILLEDEDFLVINKPPSMPVHPCGLYRFNTLLLILERELERKNLFVTHRLDRLTSGILIFAKSSEKSKEIHEGLNSRDLAKEYVCRVEGNFPDETVVCNKPLKQFYRKMGVSLVHPLGKLSVTEFRKLSFNGKSSLVLCKPLTGRTHQIRVHLQYLGHPILNDPLYNSEVFGPGKGKNGAYSKSIEQLLQDLLVEHCSQWWLETSPVNVLNENAVRVMEKLNSECNSDWLCPRPMGGAEYEKDSSRIVHDKDCHFCNQVYRDPLQTDLFMFLHAFKYHNSSWSFETPMPHWAEESFDIL